MSDREESAKAIFLNAIEHETEESRSAYLASVCAADDELRERVEQLIAAHADDSFLEQPPLNIDATVGQDMSSVSAASPPSMEETASLAPDIERVGVTIGPFKLLQRLGEGGMGAVYMAEQSEPVRRKVALKIIKPGMDSRQVIARFEAERQALALMDHNNIARVLDAGTTEHGRPFFVMELVKGVPITEYCDENRLSPRERLELVIPVCRAIQHAHQKGVIHRDIKPTNILVATYDGRPVPKVIDFGIAKATGRQLTDKTMFTEIGQVVGTLEYMSPEQAELNQLDIDTRSDVYSLGVLLYELLTGSTPITKEQLRAVGFTEMLRTIREEEPPKPSTRLSGSGEALPSISAVRSTEPARLSRTIRGDLDWVIMKSIEKDRSRRYESASALADDLERFLLDEPVAAGPPGSAYRISKFVRKHSRAIGTAASMIVLLLGGIVVSTWLAVVATSASERAAEEAENAKREAKNALAQTAIANQARARTKVLAEKERTTRLRAEESLYFSRIAVVQAALRNGDLTAARLALQECLPTSATDYRNWEWYYLAGQTGSSALVLPEHDKPGHAQFSPDGTLLVDWIGSTGAINVWDAQKGRRLYTLWPTPRADSKSKSCPPIFSPKGDRLAWSRDGKTLEILDCRTGRVLESWAVNHAVIRPAWHPSMTQLATFGEDGAVRIWDLQDKRLVHEMNGLPTSGSFTSHVGWSFDGSHFAFGMFKTINIYDTSTWKLVASPEPYPSVPVWGWAPKSNRLLYTAGKDANPRHRVISIWDPNQEQPIPVTDWYSAAFYIQWSPDGKQLAWVHRVEGTVHVHDGVTGEEQRVFEPGHVAGARWVAWSPDGTRLASVGAEGSAKIWDLTASSNKPTATLLGHRSQVRWVAWNPNGDSVGTYSYDKTVRLWQLENGASGSQVFRTENPIAALSWGPEGKRLAAASQQTAWLQSSAKVWDMDTGKPIGEPVEGGEHLAWNAQNRLLCLQPDRWDVRLIDPEADVEMTLSLENRPETPPTNLPVKGSGVAWSADGRWLAMSTIEGAYVWDLARRSAIRVDDARPIRSTWATSLAWRPDGSQLAVLYRGDNPELVVYQFEADQSAFQPRWRLRWPGIGYGGNNLMSWRSDGELIAICGPGHSIRLLRAEDGKQLSIHRGHSGPIWQVDWSPDGARFATASTDATIRIWSPASELAVLELRGHSRLASSVVWHEDGMRLASGGYDRTIRIWDARNGYVESRSADALNILNEQILQRPEDSSLLKVRSEVLLQDGKWQRAAEDLDTWLSREPDRDWYATGWWVRGPEQDTQIRADQHTLEADLDLTTKSSADISPSQPQTAWRFIPRSNLHYLNLERIFERDGIAAFALSRIYSRKQQRVRLRARANDALGIWLNGESVYADSSDRVRKLSDPFNEAHMTLAKGWNTLVLKVVNAPDTNGFEVALEIEMPGGP